jgi:hypothetical protein
MKVKCIKSYNECKFKRRILKEKTWIKYRGNCISNGNSAIYVFNLFKNTYEDYLSFHRNENKIDCTVDFIYDVLRIDKTGRYLIRGDSGNLYAFSPKNFIEL